ncbi:hypothetical protein E4U17_002571 [Claviceps sp. LM77 group G4]|nr:hypothetical protein E4U17_002571 [Claviceps sp. LM77 group G4]
MSKSRYTLRTMEAVALQQLHNHYSDRRYTIPSWPSLTPTTGVFVPSWDVALEPGQHDSDKIVVNGTIQQVDAYMEAHYPGWYAKLANFTSSHSAPAKRAPESWTKKAIKCNRLLRQGRTSAILEGVNLRSISRDRHPRNGPGPRSCGSVSCSWDGVIVWCNDDEAPKTLDAFSDIAAGAATIVKICALNGDVFSGTGLSSRENGAVMTSGSGPVLIVDDGWRN